MAVCTVLLREIRQDSELVKREACEAISDAVYVHRLGCCAVDSCSEKGGANLFACGQHLAPGRMRLFWHVPKG